MNDPDEIEFLCGLRLGGFEFTFDADSLRRFVRCGEAALAEMDAREKQAEGA